MYKCILQKILTGPNTSVKYFDSFVLALKYHNCSSTIFRLTNTTLVRGLGTCSSNLCEKREVASSLEDGVKSSDNNALDTKTNPVTENVYQKSVPEESLTSEKTTTLVTEDESESQSHCSSEPAAANKLQEKVKSGKEGLLDLLGAMKIEVTTKRKLMNQKAKREFFSTPKVKTGSMEKTSSLLKKATETPSSQSEALAPELVAAASAAASALPNPSQAESELLQQLRQHETFTESQKKGDVNNIGQIIAEMKIGKNSNRFSARTTDQIRFDDDGRGYTRKRGITGDLDSVRKRRSLFTAKRLNIFSPSEYAVEPTDARPTLWDIDYTNQVSTASNQMPQNGFEEMIQWTHQGKLWKYPIDNEDGLEEEANVPFHEHVFLEKHLEEGFPRQGPIRHFMELVIAGLCRNSHLTVQQKKDHIFWFRDYFCQKEEVLREDGVYLNEK